MIPSVISKTIIWFAVVALVVIVVIDYVARPKHRFEHNTVHNATGMGIYIQSSSDVDKPCTPGDTFVDEKGQLWSCVAPPPNKWGKQATK
jgi:hypothetical protein